MMIRFWTGSLVTLFVAATSICIADESTGTRPKFCIESRFFRHTPGESWDSTVPLTGVSCSGGGCQTLGYAKDFDGVNYKYRFIFELSDKPFGGVVTLEPETSGSAIEAKEFKIPLSDMQSTTVELLRAKNGEVLYCSIMPTVKTEYLEAKLASESDLLETWNLDSVVLLDDIYYVGKLKNEGSTVAWMEIAGVARVSFSLVPFGEAKPIGVLNGKELVIHGPDNHTVEISNVQIGSNGVELPNGPFKVFVEWQAPSEETLQSTIQYLKKRMANQGSNEVSFQHLIDRLESGNPVMVGSGGGPAWDVDSKNPYGSQ